MPDFQDNPVVSRTNNTNTPAVSGESFTLQGIGVSGRSAYASGVYGESERFNGVLGVSTANGHSGVAGVHDGGVGNGVYGRSKGGDGVQGYSSAEGHAGVAGANDDGNGVGVYGRSAKQAGVYGETTSTTGGAGVWGEHKSSGSGVVGKSATGVGVFGKSEGLEGIKGETNSTFFAAVAGISLNRNRDRGGGGSAGIFGKSEAGEGVHGETNSNFFAAVAGIQLNPDSKGAGVYGEHRGNGPAGFFAGDVYVAKKLTVAVDIVLANADCAEDFDIAGLAKVEPGTVMVIDSEGLLQPSDRAYDKRVAGVISGAGNYKPGIVLDKQESSRNRMPIALLGKVYCKVDANYGAIEVGDLLTTSPTPGYAMKADDPMKAFGSVIGKALKPLAGGEGLIPILIALQ